MSEVARGERVAVVTGGAAGIGAAIAEELGRQGYYVVTVDPGVALDGSPGRAGGEATTAQRIVEAGGRARASATSVTDEPAVGALFAELVDEFGALDTVVNVAGISRPSGFASGTQEDWDAVLAVHLEGYLTVLRTALPLMAAAGRGRILGVTSGSGWRPADAGAYSCAKRAVAALTWQIGATAPPGVSVNALSPIAATRMVTAALSRQAAAGNASGRSAASGGVSLATGVPPPEHLGPIGAYLAGEDFGWCRGQIMFSNGSEIAWVGAPHLLEVVQATDVGSLRTVVETATAAVLAPAEVTQTSSGGGNPRLGSVFAESSEIADGGTGVRRCVVVADDPVRGAALAATFATRGVECVAIDTPARDLAGATEQLGRVAGGAGSVDAVAVSLGAVERTRDDGGAVPGWQRVLDAHAGLPALIRGDAAWARAVADLAAAHDRPVRVVTLTDAATAGGWSRGQASAQLARAAHGATSDRVDAFAISVESGSDAAWATATELAAHLVCGADTASLSGAELVVDAEWFGLRSHPRPMGTLSYDGPAVPDWVDGALRGLVAGPAHRVHTEEGR